MPMNAPAAKLKTKNRMGFRALNKRGDKMPVTVSSTPPNPGKCFEENTAYFGHNLVIGSDNPQPTREGFLCQN